MKDNNINKDGIFFQHEYDSPEEFDQACNEIGNLEQQWQISRATETLNRLVKQGSGKRAKGEKMGG
jgi:hypothetical protein